MKPRSIVISTNSAWNIFNFRRDLIASLRQIGYRIVALAPDDGYGARLAELGTEFVPVSMDRSGVSPLGDLRLLARYHSLLARIRPDVFLGYTIKPNIYGSIAAHVRGIPVINNVSGLGTAFMRPGLLAVIAASLYKRSFGRSRTVFFQNGDDRRLFLEKGIVRPEQARLLPGSGIDLRSFVPPASDASRGAGLSFLFVGRLLWDKGLREFVEAARIVRADRPEIVFRILGFLDPNNRTAVSAAELQSWVDDGVIEYLGASDDVRPYVAAADCIVLPSYREGLPRTLLEGAAMARPLIATDVPGCREVVEDGINGYLCEVRNALSLAHVMLKLIGLPPDKRDEMGQSGRRKVEAQFDQAIVIDSYLRAIEEALTSGPFR